MVAVVAYAGDPERRAPAHALAAASHMAAFDPRLVEATARLQDRARDVPGVDRVVRPAADFARAYLDHPEAPGEPF